MTNLIINPILAGIGISIISGPIGSLMMWNRMSYFGDTLAHATLLGVCIATMLNVNVYYGLITTCLIIAIILTIFSKGGKFTSDSTLSILSNSIFAAGLICATLMNNSQVDLVAYLCGDILSITNQELIWIFSVNLIVICTLLFFWDRLVFITISRELAIANGIEEKRISWIFVLLISLIFAISIRLVGILLINALLVIPCSTAKIWAKGPTQMAIGGSLCSCLSIFLGINGSLIWDLATGPMIVVSATILLIISVMIHNIAKVLNKIK